MQERRSGDQVVLNLKVEIRRVLTLLVFFSSPIVHRLNPQALLSLSQLHPLAMWESTTCFNSRRQIWVYKCPGEKGWLAIKCKQHH